MVKRKAQSKTRSSRAVPTFFRPAGDNSSVMDMDLHGKERRDTNRGFIELVNS